MRTTILVLASAVLAACGQSGEEPLVAANCELVSSEEVTSADTSLGFSADSAVAALDGRAWSATWNGDELYDGSSVTRVTTTASLSGAVRKLELAELDHCQYVGTFLFVPVELGFTDAEGTFAGSGTADIAVFGLEDQGLKLDYGDTDIVLDKVPADLTAAAEDALTQGSPGDFSASLEGDASALFLHLQVANEERNQFVAVATAALTSG